MIYFYIVLSIIGWIGMGYLSMLPIRAYFLNRFEEALGREQAFSVSMATFHTLSGPIGFLVTLIFLSTEDNGWKFALGKIRDGKHPSTWH